MNIHEDTRGYIVVETILAFVPFTMAMLGIVMLINVVSMQSRVHFALTQTAHELSIMSYLDYAAGQRTRDTPTLERAVRLTNLLTEIFPRLDTINHDDIRVYFDFDERALSEAHLLSVFGRHMGEDSEIPIHRSFDFTQSFIYEDTLILIVTYDVDFVFAGPLTPFLSLTVTQQAATRLWRRGGGQGLSYFRTDMK